jgi:peroxiredoxin
VTIPRRDLNATEENAPGTAAQPWRFPPSLEELRAHLAPGRSPIPRYARASARRSRSPAEILGDPAREESMAIQVGEKIPEVKLKAMTADGIKDVSTAELFGGKRVVLFAVPGAFTPTCSAKHLPGFVEHADAIRARGVDRIVCLSVNDAFVMGAWAKAQGVGEKVMLVADGNAEFSNAVGLAFDGSGFGMGTRSQRYAMIVQDGVVKNLFVEKPMKFEVSSAEAVLAKL